MQAADLAQLDPSPVSGDITARDAGSSPGIRRCPSHKTGGSGWSDARRWLVAIRRSV
jgi:hypothetical protein